MPLGITSDTLKSGPSGEAQFTNGAVFGLAGFDACAIVQANSLGLGLLPPRMTATQRGAIASPSGGLLLYDTTNNKLDFFDSSVWKSLVSTDVSTFVVGAVPFATGAHHLSDDPTNLFWDSPTNCLGVRTDTPVEPLTIDVGSDTHGGLEVTNSNSGTGAQAGIILRTVHDAVNQVGTGTTYGWQLVARSDTWTPSAEREDLMLEYRDGATWRYVAFFEHDTGNVGIGTGVASPAHRLDVAGTINTNTKYRVGSWDIAATAGSSLEISNWQVVGGAQIFSLINNGSSFIMRGGMRSVLPGGITLSGGTSTRDTPPGALLLRAVSSGTEGSTDANSAGANAILEAGDGSVGAGAQNGPGGYALLRGGLGAGSGSGGNVYACFEGNLSTQRGKLVVSEIDVASANLAVDSTGVGFFSTTPVAQESDIVALTDSSGGSANNTIQALTDPADTPATADALRDDLVANLIPELRNNYADLAAKYNALRDLLRAYGLMA